MSKSGKGDILIVDDQVATLKVLTTMLTEQGYRVRQAISGPLALKAVQKSPPDLILLDIVMPDMGGYEVCERLKADESTRDIPVIFISALDDVQDKVKAFAVGGVDYMSRLFQEKEVLARLETHLALRAMQKELEEKNAQLEQEIAERKRAEERLQRFADRLETLHVIDVGILSARSPEEIAQFALAGVRYMAPCRRAVIVEFDFEAQEGVLLAVDVDQETTIEKGTRVPLEPMRDIIEVLDRGQSYVMEDLLASAEKHPLAAALFAEGLRSGIIIPLMVEGTLIGSLSLHADSPGLFDREQIMIAREVADSLAVALQNARLVGALRESEERYRSLFDGVPVGLYRSTPEGQLLDINLALVEMGRFPDRQSALAANLTDRYVDPEERGRLLATIEQEGIVRDYEYQARRFDGTIILVKDTVRVIRDANGQALSTRGVWRTSPSASGRRRRYGAIWNE